MNDAVKFLIDLASNNTPSDWGLTFMWLLAMVGVITMFFPPKDPL